MKKFIIVAFVACVSLASCSPSASVARHRRVMERNDRISNGPVFPGSSPCCEGCVHVQF